MSLLLALEVTVGGGELERIGVLEIRNDGTHEDAPGFGNYNVALLQDGRWAERVARVVDFDREEGAWALVAQAVQALVMAQDAAPWTEEPKASTPQRASDV